MNTSTTPSARNSSGHTRCAASHWQRYVNHVRSSPPAAVLSHLESGRLHGTGTACETDGTLLRRSLPSSPPAAGNVTYRKTRPCFFSSARVHPRGRKGTREKREKGRGGKPALCPMRTERNGPSISLPCFFFPMHATCDLPTYLHTYFCLLVSTCPSIKHAFHSSRIRAGLALCMMKVRLGLNINTGT